MNVRLNDRAQSKPVAIIDSHLSINVEANIFSTASHCHIYHDDEMSCHADRGMYSNSTYHPIPVHNGAMDLTAVIHDLGMLGYHDVWVEAGGAFFSSLHQEGLVQRTYLYIVPTNLGCNALSAYQKTGLFNRAHAISWYPMGDNMIACLDWQEGECLLD